jgi:hypothetical protein
MSKTIIGWIAAGIVLFACLAVIAAAAIMGFSLNNDLTKTKADLAAANQVVSDKTTALDSANTSITKLNSDLSDAKAETAKIQTLETALEYRFSYTVCPSPSSFNYDSKESAISSAVSFARTYRNVGSVINQGLLYGYQGNTTLWTITIVYDVSNTSVTNQLVFFLFPDKKSTFFGNDACWLELPG